MMRGLSPTAAEHVARVKQLLADDPEGTSIRAALAALVTDNGDGATATPGGLREQLRDLAGVRIGQEPPKRLPALPGVPFLYQRANAHLSGPTGAGKSAVAQACAHDAALNGLRTLYLSFEIDGDEADARATQIAQARGDHQQPERVALLARNLVFADGWTLIPAAYTANPGEWAAALQAEGYGLVIVDPASAATSCVGLDDADNADWMTWRGRIIAPLREASIASLVLDNIGHDDKASKRAKGASQKGNAADVSCYSKAGGEPGDPGLVIVVSKVRSTRAPFRNGDSWIAYREGASGPVSTAQVSREALDRAATIVLQAHSGHLGRDALRDRVRAAPHRVSITTKALAALLADLASDPASAVQHDPRRGYHADPRNPAPTLGAGHADGHPAPTLALDHDAGAGTPETPDEHRETDPAPNQTTNGAGQGKAPCPVPGGSIGPRTAAPDLLGPFDPFTEEPAT